MTTNRGRLVRVGKKRTWMLERADGKGKLKPVQAQTCATLWPFDTKAVEGQEVEFDLIKGQPARIRRPGEAFTPTSRTGSRGAGRPQGGRARPTSVVAASVPPTASALPHPGLSPDDELSTADGRFVYPYNFVRVDPAHAPQRGPAPGHHWLSPKRLSGKFAVTIEAHAPLFIPAAKPTQGERGAAGVEGHCHFPFHRDEAGRPTIPATSLKGVLRSLYESLTTSCLSVMPSGAVHPHFRYTPSRDARRPIVPEFKPAIVEANGSGLALRPCREVVWMNKDALRGKAERDPVSVAYRRDGGPTGPVKRHEVRGVPEDQRPPEGQGPGSDASGLFKPSWLLQSKAQPPRRQHRHELVFVPDPSSALIPIPDPVRRACDRVHEAQRALAEGSEYHTRPERGALRRLQVGDPVYFRQPEDTRYKLEISRTAVPRLSSDWAIGDLLPAAFHRCTSADALCPACRVFGQVNPAGRGAFKGHLRVGVGRWAPDNGGGVPAGGDWEGEWTELCIQGTPHPESGNQYLIDPAHQDRAATEYQHTRFEAGKAVPAGVLRGRKRYWVRDRADAAAWTMPQDHPYRGQQQNIHAELMPPDVARFRFDVRFEQLTQEELGALVFAIELPWPGEPGQHLLGRGKPLGLGRCTMRVDRDASLVHDDPTRRYRSLGRGRAGGPAREGNSPTRHPTAAKLLDGALQAFVKTIVGERVDWSSLPAPLADLKRLTQPKKWTIRYPAQFARAADAEALRRRVFGWFKAARDHSMGPASAKRPFERGDSGAA